MLSLLSLLRLQLLTSSELRAPSPIQDDLNSLRKFLPHAPESLPTDPISLPRPVLSLLAPLVSQPPPHGSNPGTSSVTVALTARVRILQQENDELYELLKCSHAQRLQEEVHVLRRDVGRLERALKGQLVYWISC